MTTSDNGTWENDAPLVARLRENGAVLLGKTTTPEFGWKGVTDSPLTGITRNPWNPEKTPGGSSGGAAAAAGQRLDGDDGQARAAVAADRHVRHDAFAVAPQHPLVGHEGVFRE